MTAKAHLWPALAWPLAEPEQVIRVRPHVRVREHLVRRDGAQTRFDRMTQRAELLCAGRRGEGALDGRELRLARYVHRLVLEVRSVRKKKVLEVKNQGGGGGGGRTGRRLRARRAPCCRAICTLSCVATRRASRRGALPPRDGCGRDVVQSRARCLWDRAAALGLSGRAGAGFAGPGLGLRVRRRTAREARQRGGRKDVDAVAHHCRPRRLPRAPPIFRDRVACRTRRRRPWAVGPHSWRRRETRVACSVLGWWGCPGVWVDMVAQVVGSGSGP